MPVTCPECGKECANESGLRLHSKKHVNAVAETPIAEVIDVLNGMLKLSEAKGFEIWGKGDEAVIVKDGNRLTPPMPIDKAEIMRSRWITSKH